MTDAFTPDPAAPEPAAPVDTSVPNSARIWNYWLGGTDNLPVDREAGDQYARLFPDITVVARSSRAFLTRAVRYLAGEAGIRQFLDVGAGLPTAENTHQVAQSVAPDSRILYVDHDPFVLAHGRALLTSTSEGAAGYVEGDLYEPGAILRAAARHLDLDRPVALMLMGVIGHIGDYEQARSIVRRLLDGLPSGSHLTLYDGTNALGVEEFDEAQDDYNESGAIPYHLRSPEQIAGFFEGLDLVEPGVVSVTRWRPESGPSGELDQFGGVGRKP